MALADISDEELSVISKRLKEANILFVKAESSAHLVARVCQERVVLFKGNLVSGEFK